MKLVAVYEDFETDCIALAAAGDIVETVAYNRAGSWNTIHVTKLMLIAADLQRLSKIETASEAEAETPSGYPA